MKNRSIELDSLSELFELQNVEFVALQKDVNFTEIAKYPFIKNLGIDFVTFEDSAKALEDIDVLITVDTAMLHLAGTMGVKTFLILPQTPEWRWFSDTSKTPWYNSVTIFKQSKNKDLGTIVKEIKKNLQNLSGFNII